MQACSLLSCFHLPELCQTGNPPSEIDMELRDDTRLPLRRPVLLLMDLVATVRAANPTEIAELEAALRQRFAVDSSQEALRMAITCVHAGRGPS